jgi:GAF domain-containing protein
LKARVMTEAARRWDEALAQMAKLASAAEDPGDVAATLARLCVAAVEVVGVSGAGVSLMAEHGRRGFGAASDASSQQLEELQFTLGEGPCVDALRTGRPVLVPDLLDGHRQRWPGYSSAAQDLGVRAVFAFPIQVGGARLGVLDVFRDQPGSLTREQTGLAVTFADVALMVVLDGQQRAPAGELPQGFVQSPGLRAEIAQAQGMIMMQLGISITDALVRLRAYAYAEGRPLSEVARDVVARRIRFDAIP